jgi:capsid protein
MFNNKKIDELKKVNTDLIEKTHSLNAKNVEIQNSLNRLTSYFTVFTGENTINELGIPKEIVIDYESLRTRSWEFLLKNHLAGLIVQKRVDWQIGAGLLFNSKPSLKPFLDYYGNEDQAVEAQTKFIRDCEYLFRNYSKTTLVDYSKEKNLHELTRHADYNASGDGDVLLVMRVKKGLPTLQVISGQCVINPALTKEIPKGNSILEGVEYDNTGKVVAYHVQIETNVSNGVITPNAKPVSFETERVKAYFSGTDIRSAWLYKQSDLQKAGETRAMPLISHIFETLKHVNDYLIANSKHAQLMAQLVFALEKDQNSNGERVFDAPGLNSLNMGTAAEEDVNTNIDVEAKAAANSAELKLNGNGIVLDLPKGVKSSILNPNSQLNQAGYLESVMQTLSAAVKQPYEVLVSSYNSNYTASMGARSDFQYILDIGTELIPANQLNRKVFDMFVYLKVLDGSIDCPPLAKAYSEKDTITIQAITNSTFEGTKLKPIDPLKFIKSLREQMPASIRDLVPLNSNENLINAASGSDYESIITQVKNEARMLNDELAPEEEETETEA